MKTQLFTYPVDFLEKHLNGLPQAGVLRDYQTWWEQRGLAISEAVDRQGTPGLRMFDRFGQRVDEILYPPEYWEMLRQGYRAGVIWRAHAGALLDSYLLG